MTGWAARLAGPAGLVLSGAGLVMVVAGLGPTPPVGPGTDPGPAAGVSRGGNRELAGPQEVAAGRGGPGEAGPQGLAVSRGGGRARTRVQTRAVAVALPARAGAVALPVSTPTGLDIPAIGVHSAVMQVGLNRDGSLQVPPLAADAPAGWYRNLPTPGAAGAAVLVGHVDTVRDGPAVFYRLGELRPGDRIAVRRADHRTATFTVTEVAEYRKSAFPTAAVYRQTPRPTLRLITCGGPFDAVQGSYLDNVVVYAELAGPAPAPAR